MKLSTKDEATLSLWSLLYDCQWARIALEEYRKRYWAQVHHAVEHEREALRLRTALRELLPMLDSGDVRGARERIVEALNQPDAVTILQGDQRR